MLAENWKTYAANQNGQNTRLFNGVKDVKSIQENLTSLWKQLKLGSDRRFRSIYNGLSYLGLRFQEAISSNNLLKEIVRQDNELKTFNKDDYYRQNDYEAPRKEISPFDINEDNVDMHAVKAINQFEGILACGAYSDFIPVEAIIENYLNFSMFLFDFDRSDYKEEKLELLKRKIISLGRNKLYEIFEIDWKYDRRYDAFINVDYDPFEENNRKDEYGFLWDIANEKIRAKNNEIKNLKNQIKDLKIQLATDRECLVITSENDLENYLVDCCEKLGWECRKQQPKKLGKGVPDRLIRGTGDQKKYVELKLPNGQLSQKQREYHQDLYLKYGMIADVIDTKEKVDLLIKELARTNGSWDEVTVDNVVAIDKIKNLNS